MYFALLSAPETFIIGRVTASLSHERGLPRGLTRVNFTIFFCKWQLTHCDFLPRLTNSILQTPSQNFLRSKWALPETFDHISAWKVDRPIILARARSHLMFHLSTSLLTALRHIRSNSSRDSCLFLIVVMSNGCLRGRASKSAKASDSSYTVTTRDRRLFRCFPIYANTFARLTCSSR